MKYEKISESLIKSAIEVHKTLGPGLLESAYEQCLAFELTQKGISFKLQQDLPVIYKGIKLDCGYRIDLFVEGCIIIELKSVEKILSIHSAQILTYMKLAKVEVGLLINFNVPVLKDGIKRFIL